jgi:hypothetical protein
MHLPTICPHTELDSSFRITYIPANPQLSCFVNLLEEEEESMLYRYPVSAHLLLE